MAGIFQNFLSVIINEEIDFLKSLEVVLSNIFNVTLNSIKGVAAVHIKLEYSNI